MVELVHKFGEGRIVGRCFHGGLEGLRGWGLPVEGVVEYPVGYIGNDDYCSYSFNDAPDDALRGGFGDGVHIIIAGQDEMRAACDFGSDGFLFHNAAGLLLLIENP